jgi:bifunctional non-homologous end joining protein LigD
VPVTMVEGRRIALTNLDKVLFPETRTTKGELVHYYTRIASALLPHLRDRPISFVRYPDGGTGHQFVTKHLPPGTPAWVHSSDTPGKTETIRQVVVQDLPTLVWAANLVAELHTPQWREDAYGIADRLVVDLDPGAPADILTCRDAAFLVRERLAADGVTAYAKTSGSKGLHLVAALEPVPSDEVTAYTKALAVELARAHPSLIVAEMAKARRPGRVFLDFSQNAAAKTTAAPYTVRARPTPTVSTPVGWDELAAASAATDLVFTIDEVPERIARMGDLLAPMLNPRRGERLPGVGGARPGAARGRKHRAGAADPSGGAAAGGAGESRAAGTSGKGAPRGAGTSRSGTPRKAEPRGDGGTSGAGTRRGADSGAAAEAAGRGPGQARTAATPESVSPVLSPPVTVMRPKTVPDLPDEDGMPGGVQYSIKLDGYRVVAFALGSGRAVLQSRTGRDLAQDFPTVAAAVAALPAGTVLDGELCAWHDGRLAFDQLARTRAARDRDRVAVTYAAFDLLAEPGRDVRGLPLRDRWEVLHSTLDGVGPPLEIVMATTDRAEAVGWQRALAPTGIEGLVAKGLGTRYSARLRTAWQTVESPPT